MQAIHRAPRIHHSPAPPRADRGFTLVEVMVSTFVLIFGICSAIIVLQSGFKAMDNSRNTTLASQIMQSEMERIRLLPWDTSTVQLDAGGQPVLDASNNPVLKPAIVRLPASEQIDLLTIFPAGETTDKLISRFTVTRTAADLAGQVGEVKLITIQVTWTGLDGISHTRTSSTQYAKNGLYDYYYTKASI